MDTVKVLLSLASFCMSVGVIRTEDGSLCGPHLACVPSSRCSWKDIGDQNTYSCGAKHFGYVCCPVSHAISGENPGHSPSYGRFVRSTSYSQHSSPPSEYGHQSTYKKPGYGTPSGYSGSNRYGGYTPSYGNRYGSSRHEPYYMDFYHDQYEKYFGYTLSKQAKELLRNYRPKEECGVRNQSPADMARIASGYLHDYGFTSFAEFPWHVALLVEQRNFGYGKSQPTYRYHCGATLIHRSLLITAAHCVRGVLPHKLLAHLGDWNLQGTTGELFPAIKRKISRVFIHSGYNPSTYKNDIALLQMMEPVDTYKTPHIAPICLPLESYELKDHSKCFIVGWGDDVYKPNFGSNILKSVSVTYALEKECTSRLYASIKNLDDKFILDTDSQKCILGSYGKDACVGDGGGGVVCPLSKHEGPDVCNSPNCAHEHYFLFGVISYGSPVCGENSVTIITDVVKNLNWIYTLLEPAGGLKNFNYQYYHKGYKGRAAEEEDVMADVNATSTE
ncbi:phenoloxidase-activating factor 2-like [Palaemon carinicauda]|uniref:phenoloxidase-activating factor 2-like n=1 Tax=Palaemon carinicauda TaxID=392227 RepID=UPI0035B6248B